MWQYMQNPSDKDKHTPSRHSENSMPTKQNEFVKVARTAQFVEKLKRHSRLRLDEMTCWARYKYSETERSLRVHMWDLFDEALTETKTFDKFFERIWEKLKQRYADQGFPTEQ